ncbi:MAG TPA: GHMP kinase [Thermodesulfobacteriota bacterium]|nr:GHMP kinase [Thermodesulfobacteriota bacterium]
MIISRTPFRISFAGGGTDLLDFYSREQGSVVSAAIDKYMYICVNKRFDHTIRVSYSKTETVDKMDDIRHPIVRECMKLTGVREGVEITSVADIPSGTGLGSSSSFTVGLLNALYAYRGVHVTPEKLAVEASRVEIDILGEPIGKQDQFIAAYGGLQHIRFNPDETVFVDPVVCSRETKRGLSENLLMFYTGDTRKSSSILKEQKKKTGARRDSLVKMRDLSVEIKGIITNGKNLSEFGAALDRGWKLKRGLVSSITNGHIDSIYSRALESGALGGKLLGAGGGGFLLFYVEGHNHARLREALGELREVRFNLEPEGSKIIFVGVSSW